MRISVVVLSLLVIVLLNLTVHESEAVYAYAVKGFVRDVRHKPHLFIGAWALKKFIKLKLIKLKFLLYKKIKIKKKIKVALILALLKKFKRKIHNHFHHRRRRQTQAQDFIPYSPEELNEYYEYDDYQELPGNEPTEEEIMTYLNMAKELDNQACLPKGVCEVVAKGNGTHLNHFESMVYDLYGEGNYPQSPRESPTYMYEYAAYIGKTSRDVRTCERTFSSCSEQPQNLNQFMESTFTSEMCDFPDRQVYNSINDQFHTSSSTNSHPSFSSFQSTQHPSSQLQQQSFSQQSSRLPGQRTTGAIKFESK